MAGTTDKVKGAVKEGAGKLTGDKRTEAEGKTDRAKGEVKGAARTPRARQGRARQPEEEVGRRQPRRLGSTSRRCEPKSRSDP